MATSNQQSFAATYGPYAQQAGAKLGVDPNIVLGQWGIETGWQTPASGNLAGISPGGRIANYSSPQQFTDAYVSTISNNFPGAVNTGSDAQAFNNGLVNGPKGSYYQGNNAASLGLHTPTALDQSAYLGSLTNAQNANLVQYSGPAAGTLAQGPNPTSYYPDGTPMYDPNLGVVPQTGSGGEVFTDPTTGYTAIPGTSTGASPSTNTMTSAEAGMPGYLPPAQTGGPFALGLTTGLATAVNSWISGAETAVGTAFKNAMGGVLTSIENWVGRGFLIIIGLVLLALALWRIMDPSGEKTRVVMRSAAEAA
jgi:hypothetical protein